MSSSITARVACFLSRGEEFLLKEDYAQALDSFENALAMAQQNQDPQTESVALQRLGTLHLIQDQPELAISLVEQAMAISLEEQNPYLLYDCHRQLAHIYKVLGDFELALKHFEIAESIRADILQTKAHPAIQYAYPSLLTADTGNLAVSDFAPSSSTIVLLFRTIVEHANIGVAIFQDGCVVYANNCLQDWLGYTHTELRQLAMTDLMAPSAYWSVLQCHWKRISDNDRDCHCEKQLLCKGGHAIDVEFNATAIDYRHRPAILAFVRDITQRKRVEFKLKQSEKQFRTLFNHMPIGLYRFAVDGRPIEVNPAMVHMLGFADRERFFEDYGLHADANRKLWLRYLRLAEATEGCEIKMTRQDGRDMWVRMSAKAVTDQESNDRFYEGSMEDISEIKMAFFALEELAVRDPLTHVYNRRHFFELANRELARAGRFKRPLSLVILDIDYFKAINDQHGHWAGDQVLRAAALRLQSNLRQSDILARYGGEEFVILMPETAQSQAWNGAERLRNVLSVSHIFEGDDEILVTASVGVTSWTPARQDRLPQMDELFKQADRALYQAKQAGRNQTIAYSSS